MSRRLKGKTAVSQLVYVFESTAESGVHPLSPSTGCGTYKRYNTNHNPERYDPDYDPESDGVGLVSDPLFVAMAAVNRLERKRMSGAA